MSLVVVCPRCQQAYAAELQLAGMVLQCPACQTPMQVPPGATEVAAPPVVDPPVVVRPAETPGFPLAVKAAMAAAGGVAAIVVLVILIGAAMNRGVRPVASQPADESDKAQAASGFAAGPVASESAPPPPTIMPAVPVAAPAHPPAAADRPASAEAAVPDASDAREPTASPPPGLSSLIKGALAGTNNETVVDREFSLLRVGSISMPCESAMHFGPLGCPVMVRQRTVVEWLKGEDRASPQWGNEYPSRIYLSPRGDTLVSEGLAFNIYRAPRGQRVFHESSSSAKFVACAGETIVLALGLQPNPGALSIIRLGGAREMSQIEHPSDPLYFQQASIAGSPDGNVCAVVKIGAQASIALYDLATGDKLRERSHDMNTVESLCFSPEGSELHVYHREYDQLRIQVWNRTLNVVDQVELSLKNPGGSPTRFECLPAKAGWVLGDWLIDRETRQPVLRISAADDAAGFAPPSWFAHRDYVLADLPALRRRAEDESNRDGRYHLYRIPWSSIRASQAAHERGDPAWLGKEAKSVGVRVRPSASGGALLPTAQASIEDQLTRRGFSVAANASVVVEVSARPWSHQGLELDTYTIQWLADGKPLAGWRFESTYRRDEPAPIVVPKASGTGSRTLRFSGAKNPASRLEFPYFVPKSPELVTLPLRVQ